MRTIDWTHDQHFASGWVSARVPAHFTLRKSESRRERLPVRSAADWALVAVNGLGARVAELYVADRDGRIHRAAGIAPGAEVRLEPASGLRAEGSPEDLREAAHAASALGLCKMTRTNPTGHLRPGMYAAVLDGTPFVEEPLRGARPRHCRSVVLGIMPAAAGPATRGGRGDGS